MTTVGSGQPFGMGIQKIAKKIILDGQKHVFGDSKNCK
jgi:hypothetical protein